MRLRWIWSVQERGERPTGTEHEYVTGAAAWARAHAASHLPHAAVTADGTVVGMAWLALTARVATTSSFDRLSGDLQSCFVMPAHRGQGIGGRLVRAVLETATALGVEHVTVHTTPDAPVVYLRNGFRSSARLLLADTAAADGGSGPAPRGSRAEG